MHFEIKEMQGGSDDGAVTSITFHGISPEGYAALELISKTIRYGGSMCISVPPESKNFSVTKIKDCSLISTENK